MRRFIPGSLIVILSGLILFLLSCTTGSCFEETESYLKASFYDNITKKLHAPDSLTLYGLNKDSIIYYKTVNVQPALIPLNASTESSAFIIKINGIADTIEFRYSSYPHLISKECGYTFYHHLDTALNYTKNSIKDIYTVNSTITTLNVENIRIFY
ncbi:MAG: DUF6452 family protein [Bacteroidales bacterium]|jgi:hypothetical protein